MAIGVDVDLGGSDGSLDILVGDLVPRLVDELRPLRWHFDRRSLQPNRRFQFIFVPQDAAAAPEEWILGACRASMRELVLEPPPSDSRLVSIPNMPDGVGANAQSVADARIHMVDERVDDSEALLNQWSSERIVEIMPDIVAGSFSRKTIAPAHVAMFVGNCRSDEDVDFSQWLKSLAERTLTRAGLASLLQPFDDKVAELVLSRTFAFQKDIDPGSPSGKHLRRLRQGLPDASMPRSTAALAPFLLRHVSRLGFDLVEAAYVLMLARAEIEHGG